jgi:hypothetical protein
LEALGFGGAFHEGIAEWYRTGQISAALLAIESSWPANTPVDDWRTKEKCLQTVIEYTRKYPEENFQFVEGPDGPLVEKSFTLSTGLYLNCNKCGWSPSRPTCGWCNECGEPMEEIEYGGIIDGLVEFSGQVYILEHKTTSQLGSYYFNQFKPNNQITGYIWGAGLLSGQRVGGAIVNAIGVYKSSATKFERQITSRSDTEIQEWLHNLKHSCQKIRDCERAGYWPLHTGSCTLYGRCEYHSVHVLGTPTEREKILEQDYVQDEWSYETRDEETPK